MAKTHDLFILTPGTTDNIIMMKGSFPIEVNTLRSAYDTYLEPGGEANMFIMFKRLGGKPLPVGPIGNDHYASFTRSIYEEEGIDSNGLKLIEGYRCPISYSIVDENGKHSYLAYLQGAEFDSYDHIFEKLEECRAFYMSGYLTPVGHPFHKLNVELMLKAKKNNIPIFFDPGPQIAIMSESLIEKILNSVDVICLNDEEAAILSKEDDFAKMIENIRNRTDALVIIKAGKDGSYIFSKEKELKHYPGFKVEVKDTMGCGDCFLAAFIYVYLNTGDIDKAMLLANAVGAKTANKYGTGRRVPHKEEIIELLIQNGYKINDDNSLIDIE